MYVHPSFRGNTPLLALQLRTCIHTSTRECVHAVIKTQQYSLLFVWIRSPPSVCVNVCGFNTSSCLLYGSPLRYLPMCLGKFIFVSVCLYLLRAPRSYTQVPSPMYAARALHVCSWCIYSAHLSIYHFIYLSIYVSVSSNADICMSICRTRACVERSPC